MPDLSIATLRRSAELLASLPDPAAAATAAALRRYEAEAPFGMTLDQALGLALAPGKTPWWEAEKRERRDTALRAIRQQSYATIGLAQAARTMITELERYSASGMRRHRIPNVSKALLDTVILAGDIPKQRRMESILRSE